MTTYIAPIGNGLGDLIVSLPAVQHLIAQGEPTVLVLRSPRQVGCAELIPGLKGSVREVDFDATALGAVHRYVNLREHPLQTDHVWGSSGFEKQYPGYRIADIVRDISRDFGIDADFENLVPLPYKARPELEDTVLLIPGSGGTFKCWRTQSWIELIKRFKAGGLPVAMAGQPQHSEAVAELLSSGVRLIETPAIADALDVVSSVSCVVSVDTGLMHLALQQLTPVAAIWINNPGSLNYLRTVKHCFPVVSPRCSKLCVSEELDKNLNLVTTFPQWEGYDSWSCHASDADRCMNNVSVDEVFEQTMKALSHAPKRAKAVVK